MLHQKSNTLTKQQQHQGTSQCFFQHFDYISRMYHPPYNVPAVIELMISQTLTAYLNNSALGIASMGYISPVHVLHRICIRM